MRAYSPDLRAKILAAVDAGMSKADAARTFGVGLSTIKRYAALRRARPSLEPLPRPGRPRTIRPDEEAALWTQLAEHPTAILAEHCALWEQSHGIHPGLSTMSRAIRKLGWTRKKERWVPPSGMRRIGRFGIGSSAE